MRIQMSKRTSRRSGFTLLQLGIVLAIGAILAAAVLPEVIEIEREKMIQRIAADIAVHADAARAFYQNNNAWPGAPAERCTLIPASEQIHAAYKLQLAAQGYVPFDPNSEASIYANPWDHRYLIDIVRVQPLAPAPEICLLRVSTLVPADLQQAFVSLVPQGRCGANCGPVAPAAGFVTCCGHVAPPGLDAGLEFDCCGRPPNLNFCANPFLRFNAGQFVCGPNPSPPFP
ncbi:MAG: hypothetical protein ACOX6T_23430 [Myxococcales bacterium]|jgi:type II secretory pathway pseudopilin PulG